MKNYQFIIYKGNEALPKGNLPEKSYKFREPNSLYMTNIIAILYSLPIFIIITFVAYQRHQMIFDGIQGWIGIVLTLATIIPHELLHAICFPKESVKYILASPKSLMFAVLCTAPITKSRFIFLSFLPNIVFGFIPFLIWRFVPTSFEYSQFLLSFSSLCILCGCGDYMNIVHAMFQMPKHSMQQLSGLNSYWFMPEDVQQ